MWPWSRKERQEADDRLATLSRRVDDLESASRRLQTEWVDTLDRLQRLGGRLAKRDERERGAGNGIPSGPPEPAPPPSRAMVDVLKRRTPRSAPTQGGS